MKPQKFQIGQAIALLRVPRSVTYHNPNGTKPALPRANEIYHVSYYETGRFPTSIGEWFVGLREMPDSGTWSEKSFTHVISTEELEKELSTINQPQESMTPNEELSKSDQINLDIEKAKQTLDALKAESEVNKKKQDETRLIIARVLRVAKMELELKP